MPLLTPVLFLLWHDKMSAVEKKTTRLRPVSAHTETVQTPFCSTPTMWWQVRMLVPVHLSCAAEAKQTEILSGERIARLNSAEQEQTGPVLSAPVRSPRWGLSDMQTKPSVGVAGQRWKTITRISFLKITLQASTSSISLWLPLSVLPASDLFIKKYYPRPAAIRNPLNNDFLCLKVCELLLQLNDW